MSESNRNREPHPFIPRKNLSGKRFGRLTVLRPAYRENTTSVWLCSCDCGNITYASGYALTSGRTQSCRCLHKELLSKRQKTHGLTDKHPIYRTWRGMKQRCLYPNHACFNRYGGRGIKICDRWLDFKNFYEDMRPTWFKGASIDRVNTNGDYTPENCRWATPKQQANNSNRNLVIDLYGTRKSLTEWCEQLNLNYRTVLGRINRGWNEYRALS